METGEAVVVVGGGGGADPKTGLLHTDSESIVQSAAADTAPVATAAEPTAPNDAQDANLPSIPAFYAGK